MRLKSFILDVDVKLRNRAADSDIYVGSSDRGYNILGNSLQM